MAEPGATPVDSGVQRGIERAARSFNLEGTPPYELLQELDSLVNEVEIGPESAAYFAEVITVASLARARFEEPELSFDDLHQAFNAWEWLFNGLIRRV